MLVIQRKVRISETVSFLFALLCVVLRLERLNSFKELAHPAYSGMHEVIIDSELIDYVDNLFEIVFLTEVCKVFQIVLVILFRTGEGIRYCSYGLHCIAFLFEPV